MRTVYSVVQRGPVLYQGDVTKVGVVVSNEGGDYIEPQEAQA